jgi:hypothetical protein
MGDTPPLCTHADLSIRSKHTRIPHLHSNERHAHLFFQYTTHTKHLIRDLLTSIFNYATMRLRLGEDE